jgi:hypothetical protein
MKEIFTALYSRFTASTALHAAVSDLYNTEAKEEAVFPYIVMSIVDNSPDTDSSQNWENYLVQFNIFSNSPSSQEIDNIFTLLKGVTDLGTGFDFYNLAISDYDTVVLKRKGSNLTKEEGIWKLNVLYSLMTTYTGQAATEAFIGNLFNLLSIY